MKERIFIIQDNRPIKKIDGYQPRITVIREVRQSGVRGRFEIHYQAEIESKNYTYAVEGINEKNQRTSYLWLIKEKGV